MKNRMFIVIIAIIILAIPVSAKNEFPDTKDHWAASSVSVLTEKSIISGWDGLFHPNEKV